MSVDILTVDKSGLAQCFFADFPYEAKDFNGINPDEVSKISGLRKDLLELALLMIDKDEETDDIRNLKDTFKDDTPFKLGDETKFSDLENETFTAVFFPLRTDTKYPSWGVVVKSSAGKTFFFNAATQEWSSFWNYEKNGPSCRLAEELAERLLKTGTSKQIFETAKNWIVTGEVVDGKVKQVDLGNKLRLITDRKFILPEENYDDVPIGVVGKTIKFADTVDAAWNHITEAGTKTLPPAEFPPETDELHVLVGGNIKAQVASIIFSNPKKVFLWHSEDSKVAAEDIKYVVERYMKEFRNLKIEVEMNHLTSKSMPEAEKTLKNQFDKIEQNAAIIFNVTSGNRIMSYAVQTIARAYRNVELIYRDIDEPEDSEKYFFTRLIYNEFPPYSGKIWGKVNERIKMEFLCGKEKYENGQDFYDKLIN